MQKLAIMLLMTASVALAGCSSDDDNDSGGGGDIPTPTPATLDELISRTADSQPVNDGLDQVNADLLSTFGDANTAPIALDDDETVESFVKKVR